MLLARTSAIRSLLPRKLDIDLASWQFKVHPSILNPPYYAYMESSIIPLSVGLRSSVGNSPAVGHRRLDLGRTNPRRQ
jgi:hypothetical protein